jgi:D-3-phosphoglycerate dehydrogenase / 2-oxoglutarate reductase
MDVVLMAFFVAVTDSPAGEDLSVERKVLVGVRVDKVAWHDPQSLIAAVRHADAILCMHAPMNESVLKALASCKIIARFGTGLDNIDCATAQSLNIPVAGVDDYCTEEVANHAMALLLAWNRKLPQYQDFVRREIWNQRTQTTGNWGCGPLSRLSSQTLGVLGFGGIGQAVARRAVAFGLRILVSTRHPEPAIAKQAGVEFTSLKDLLQHSDYISLHLPLTPETRHLINKETIRLMKPTAVLINTARGELVDEMALADALGSERLAGALLDVYERAPLPLDHPLRALKNLILTPHVAFYSEEALRELRRRAAEAVLRRLQEC